MSYSDIIRLSNVGTVKLVYLTVKILLVIFHSEPCFSNGNISVNLVSPNTDSIRIMATLPGGLHAVN